jgi:Metallopeptidase toxin 3
MRFKNLSMFSPYPTFKSWLWGLAPRVKKHPQLMDALIKFGRCTEDDMIKALLLPLFPPKVHIDPFTDAPQLRYGMTIVYEDTDMVMLNEGMLKLFEKDPSWGPILEATILHELVHRSLMLAKLPGGEHEDDDRDPARNSNLRRMEGLLRRPSHRKLSCGGSLRNGWQTTSPVSAVSSISTRTKLGYSRRNRSRSYALEGCRGAPEVGTALPEDRRAQPRLKDVARPPRLRSLSYGAAYGVANRSSPESSERRLARPPRLERGTPGLEGRCSIQLSYGRVASV